ncbi:hypothetical protein [Tahibacter sp.]|uniref:hypothetical protein n=1 Tax=Tahibacter sp. TaxID=2056211 RepID=UPI0028C4354A|nr:hypothetical protein [Tahibacter sp.]
MDHRMLVPIALFGSVVYVIKLLIDARMRILLLRAGDPEELRALLQAEAVQRRHASLRSGITLTMLALGFALIQLLGWDDITPGAIAVLAAAVGLGNFGYYALTRHGGPAPGAPP